MCINRHSQWREEGRVRGGRVSAGRAQLTSVERESETAVRISPRATGAAKMEALHALGMAPQVGGGERWRAGDGRTRAAALAWRRDELACRRDNVAPRVGAHARAKFVVRTTRRDDAQVPQRGVGVGEQRLHGLGGRLGRARAKRRADSRQRRRPLTRWQTACQAQQTAVKRQRSRNAAGHARCPCMCALARCMVHGAVAVPAVPHWHFPLPLALQC